MTQPLCLRQFLETYSAMFPTGIKGAIKDKRLSGCVKGRMQRLSGDCKEMATVLAANV